MNPLQCSQSLSQKTGVPIFFLLELNSLGWGQPVLQPKQNSAPGWTGEKTLLGHLQA